MKRRELLLAAGAASAVAVAGCASDVEDQSLTCEGDCDAVEDTSIDAHSGWDPYTDITVMFAGRFTGAVYFEGRRNGIKFAEEIDVEDAPAKTFEFDKYANEITMKVTVETEDR